MKLKPILILLAVPLLLLTSCNKKDDSLPDSSISFEFGGDEWRLDETVASLADFNSIGGGFMLTIIGRDGSPSNYSRSFEMIIISQEAIANKTYSLSDNGTDDEVGTIAILEYLQGGVPAIYSDNGTGSIIITEISSNSVSGTFSAEMIPGSSAPVEIRNGRFNNLTLTSK